MQFPMENLRALKKDMIKNNKEFSLAVYDNFAIIFDISKPTFSKDKPGLVWITLINYEKDRSLTTLANRNRFFCNISDIVEFFDFDYIEDVDEFFRVFYPWFNKQVPTSIHDCNYSR